MEKQLPTMDEIAEAIADARLWAGAWKEMCEAERNVMRQGAEGVYKLLATPRAEEPMEERLSEGKIRVILFDVLKNQFPTSDTAMMIANACAAPLYRALLATRTEASRAPAEPQLICKHCGKPIVICFEGKDCAFDRWNHPDTGSHYCGDACEGTTALPAPAEGFEKWWMKWSTDEANYRMLDEITISHQADLVGAFKNCWLEAERVARIDLLKEMASSECRACKDNSNLIIDEESGEWAHERGEGLPNYLCQAPDVVAEKLAALGAEKEGEK